MGAKSSWRGLTIRIWAIAAGVFIVGIMVWDQLAFYSNPPVSYSGPPKELEQVVGYGLGLLFLSLMIALHPFTETMKAQAGKTFWFSVTLWISIIAGLSWIVQHIVQHMNDQSTLPQELFGIVWALAFGLYVCLIWLVDGPSMRSSRTREKLDAS